ncbi:MULTISPECIES: RNA 2',3'-cyclic phosphodiesterase [Bacillaceae]|uniref:RNA 2',3'-cyclic phosphodiesterase n=1 Tax=Bacillaceae TaxID=186817 RepID=UPI001E2EA345|nr:MULTISPECIES: RNA 2',3'-cyclic phosphodiesterase [Bacillaceae]MCE4051290.1 RNA 2',3'-cyclic phosphodiesterase [Bacillus sp. Au-Bac7]MDL0436730.1 RNA 2',3'-cyclic phosphodiesterase [Niallia sp. SS-2023]UPO86899.1 RNA 2',3'-cyclic phosphodiesterase [Niallia sp. Man26]
MNTNTHYFIAIGLPEAVRLEVEAVRGKLKEAFPFKKWVHPQDYHITLAFLGAATEEQKSELITILNEDSYDIDHFTLNIDKLGVFGSQDSPRIFWLGLENHPSLHQLRENIYIKCKKAGFTLETRPYHPHITIARKWAGTERFRQNMLNSQNPFSDAKPSFQVEQFSLFQTHLNKEPKYEAIYTKKFI